MRIQEQKTQEPQAINEPDQAFLSRLADALKTAVKQQKLSKANEGKTRRPFYTEKHALNFLQSMKHVLETGEPVIIPQGDRSEGTIRTYVSQARRYLFEVQSEIDDVDYQDLWNERLTGAYLPRRGYQIQPRSDRAALQGLPVKAWRPDFMDFMQQAPPGAVFQRSGMFFSDDDHAFIQRTVMPFRDKIVCILEEHKIAIYKLTEEAMAVMREERLKRKGRE